MEQLSSFEDEEICQREIQEEKKEEKKSSENDQLTGHFQSFFNISRKNSKIMKVNQLSVLNL